LDLFPDDVTQITIFSKLSIRARMTVLIAYLDPLQKDEINEYEVKGIQTTFYFWQYLCGGVIPVIQGDVDSFSKNRTNNLFLKVLFLEKPIFRGSIFSCLYI
jgi:hypothetical protein